jgi:hypothetical protein
MGPSKSFPRLFTVAEANGILPQLRSLMERVHRNLELLRQESEVAIRQEGLSPESPELMERLKARSSIVHIIQEIHELVEEINSFGCVCKGVEEQLVDFPCQLGEEIVFLCWRYEEESVGYWHSAEDGFKGRRPLLDSHDSGNTGISYH